MSFRIVVTELIPGVVAGEKEVERYRQEVDHLELLRLIEVINAKPPRVRNRKAKVAA